MKNLSLILSILLSLSLEAQVSHPYPIDTNTNLITYQGVVELSGFSQDQLYVKGEEWIKSRYKDPGSFFNTRDRENGKIEGKHRIGLMKTMEGRDVRSGQMVKYTLTLWFKDGKYRYRISRFNLKQASYFPMENWLEEDLYKQKEIKKYLTQIDQFAKDLEADMKKFMASVANESDEDEW